MMIVNYCKDSKYNSLIKKIEESFSEIDLSDDTLIYGMPHIIFDSLFFEIKKQKLPLYHIPVKLMSNCYYDYMSATTSTILFEKIPEPERIDIDKSLEGLCTIEYDSYGRIHTVKIDPIYSILIIGFVNKNEAYRKDNDYQFILTNIMLRQKYFKGFADKIDNGPISFE